MTDLLSMLMHSSTQAHVFHLRVSPNGLAPHLALQTYYEGIVGLIDGIAESYQGMNGLIEFKAVKGLDNDVDKDNIISYFEDLVKFVHTERMKDDLKGITFIQNEIDNVEKLIYSTLYKLRNL
jgi:CRISPR/Cas system CMR-associated protein Cmr3 (group 5 of RAMP superfamily)